jgi:hypothetical protein
MNRRWALSLGLVCATAFSVFVLPFLFPPPPIQAISAANVAGFNNRLAVLSVLVLLLIVLLLAARSKESLPLPAAAEPSRRPRYWIAWSAVLLLWIIGNSLLAYFSDFRYSAEARYYVQQGMKASLYHLQLYRDLDFAYGPLLFYPVLWLRPLFSHAHHPIQAAYAVVLVAQAAIGLASLAYVLERLPITPALRRWLFPCFAALSTGWSLNYTYFRFATPLAAVIISVRQPRLSRYLLCIFAMQLLTLGISPEMGIAFAFAMLCYSGLKLVRTRQAGWLLTLPALALAVALFLRLTGPAYMSTLLQFAGGTYHLIVEPAPHILLFLVAVLWLAPLTLVSALRQGREADVIAAVFAFGIALLPAALGRADVGHVFYDGMPLLLLASIPVGAWRFPGQGLWIGAMLLSVGLGLIYTARLTYRFLEQTAEVVYLRYWPNGIAGHRLGRAALLLKLNPHYAHPIDISRLRALTGGEPVSAPETLPPIAEEELLSARMVQPAYYVSMQNQFGIASEQRTIADMNRAHWALLLPGSVPYSYETPESAQFVLGLPYPYRSRRPPFQWGRLLQKNIEENWQPYATLGDYVVYRRRSAAPTPPALVPTAVTPR